MKLIKLSDHRLRETCTPIGPISKKVRKVGEFLLSQLEPLEAFGLAAPQFGQMIRVIAVKRDGLPSLVVVNPRVVQEKGQIGLIESCKSIPDGHYAVIRPETIMVAGLNLDGYKLRFSGQGIYAAALKHEIDHLDGTMIDAIGYPMVAIACAWCKDIIRYEDWSGQTGTSHEMCKECRSKDFPKKG